MEPREAPASIWSKRAGEVFFGKLEKFRGGPPGLDVPVPFGEMNLPICDSKAPTPIF